MTTRLVTLGGTDWTDGEVLYAADLNDTIEESIQLILKNRVELK